MSPGRLLEATVYDRFPRASGDEPATSATWRCQGMVFPARAGMSRPRLVHGHEVERFPRASGDEPVADFESINLVMFSPRERG